MRILVLAGGDSDEREVSLRSGDAVVRALRTAGYTVGEADPRNGLTANTLADGDVVFPVLHGKGGEDGVIQKQLESLSIPFVGAGSTASALCFDKHTYKRFLAQNNIDCAQSDLVNYEAYKKHKLTQKPYVLKPYDGGSSIDTFLVRDIDNPPEAIKAAFEKHNQLLLEELAEGIETTVAILGDQPLPVIEIIPPKNEAFDFKNKYNGRAQELCPPQTVDIETQHKLQDLALHIHKLSGCRHLSRTDIIVTPEGRLVPLETNTIPGMTDQSLVPKAAQAASISMPELVHKLVQQAMTN